MVLSARSPFRLDTLANMVKCILQLTAENFSPVFIPTCSRPLAWLAHAGYISYFLSAEDYLILQSVRQANRHASRRIHLNVDTVPTHQSFEHEQRTNLPPGISSVRLDRQTSVAPHRTAPHCVSIGNSHSSQLPGHH